MHPRSFFVMLPAAALIVLADGPTDNLPEKVRPVPPPGIAISASDRAELEAGSAELGKAIEGLRSSLTNRASLLSLLPDVQIYHNAVRYALAHNEFYKTNEVETARALLLQGRDRAGQLAQGRAPWTTNTGLVARGYLSKIDGSVQPYGLVIPSSWQPNTPFKHRLDAWFHGRGETLTELAFINDRQRSPGEFTPRNAFVLHLYGRYCNANKFAGEIDLLEALDSVKRQYPIDENRLVIRGFSMGGAACWQFAVHYPGLWAAAAPGAGFSETAEFLKVFQNEPVQPPWYEQKLWRMYDCTDYAVNLFNCPTVAYSGEMDKQKQAADIMARALTVEGMELTHIIGPKTGHSYHADAKKELDARLDSVVSRGRDPLPREIKFTTWTLRYNQVHWLTVTGLEKHWDRARVHARILDDNSVRVSTTNISSFTLSMSAGLCPLDPTKAPRVVIDGRGLESASVLTDRSWTAHFVKDGQSWRKSESGSDGQLRKRPGLQGPIDDAFMGSFLMVTPTGPALNDKTAAWCKSEEGHAIEHWRKQFRGEARVKNDVDVTDEDIATHNLVLWGDPTSNKVLARILDKLPIQWDAQTVRVGTESFPSDHHVPALIFPNPLDSRRYVVLNSGFTFREYDYLNNARQISKLPDYAVIDLNSPVTSRAPGAIATAGFFGERWEIVSPGR